MVTTQLEAVSAVKERETEGALVRGSGSFGVLIPQRGHSMLTSIILNKYGSLGLARKVNFTLGREKTYGYCDWEFC